MPNVTKHVGKVGERPCLVVFREIPGDEDYCLVVETQGLTSEMHDALISTVNSIEAQSSNSLADVLSRRLFPDGSNMLQTLHSSRKLLKKSVDQVSLVPVPNQAIPLRDVNLEIRKIEGNYTPPKNDSIHLRSQDVRQDVPQQPVSLETDPALNAQRVENSTGTSDHMGSPEERALMLLAQAELIQGDIEALQSEITAKREQAYMLDPKLNPAPLPRKAAGGRKAK
jgi:hypothetical protein